MDKRERSDFIRKKLDGCSTVIYIRDREWGTTVGELVNAMQGNTARYQELGHDILRTITKEPGLPTVVVWYGVVEGQWQPICAILTPYTTVETLGIYYDSI